MKTEGWALLISGLGVLTGLVTLSLVLRNEFRQRRRLPPVVWGFHRYATATVDGVLCEAAELVQYGRMPTHLHQYTTVGFNLHLKEGYRVRRFVKAEDTMPLLLTDVDAESAWLVLMHSPRDDRRFAYFHYVDLEPTSEKHRDRVYASRDHLAKKRSTLYGRVQRLRWRFTNGSIVRPVGPDGYVSARLRVDRGLKFTEGDLDTILSLTRAWEGSTYAAY